MDHIQEAQDAHTRRIADQLGAIPDPVDRIKAVNDAIARGGLAHAAWARITRTTVRELLADRTKAQVGRMLGITPERVHKLSEA